MKKSLICLAVAACIMCAGVLIAGAVPKKEAEAPRAPVGQEIGEEASTASNPEATTKAQGSFDTTGEKSKSATGVEEAEEAF